MKIAEAMTEAGVFRSDLLSLAKRLRDEYGVLAIYPGAARGFPIAKGRCDRLARFLQVCADSIGNMERGGG